MRIQTKVFLSILLMASLLVSLTLGLVMWSLDQGLVEYVNQRQTEQFMPLARELERRYAQDQWQTLRDDPRAFDRLHRQLLATQQPHQATPPDTDRPPPPRGDDRPRRDHPPPRNVDRRPAATLLDSKGSLLAGAPLRSDDARRIKLLNDGSVVGFLALPGTNPLTDNFSLQFQARQETAMLAIGAVILLISGLFAYLMSPHIVRPIKQIATAANQMGRGNYQIILPDRRADELGELNRDINQLATILQRSEQLRQRWLADISHELRTPLAIIKGEIEAMLDGVRPLDLAQLASLKQEADHLHKLIDDLTDLSNADVGGLRYQKQTLELQQLLMRNRSHFALLTQEAGLTLDLQLDAAGALIYADERRLQQLLDNLITNSCKYTDAGGQVRISLSSSTDRSKQLQLVVEDSAPSVPAADLPHLFDHLYRVETSRNRTTGGAGLGLAIVQRIVSAHGGQVSAMTSELGGLKIVVHLPRA